MEAVTRWRVRVEWGRTGTCLGLISIWYGVRVNSCLATALHIFPSPCLKRIFSLRPISSKPSVFEFALSRAESSAPNAVRGVTRHAFVRVRLFPTYLYLLLCTHHLVFRAYFGIVYKITMTTTSDYTRKMAGPISRDGFSYDGHQGLYVQPDGAFHAHLRHDDASLHALLTNTPSTGPEPTKKDKDKPGHFYVAQLAHYGLKPLKTKDAAKRNLLAAFKGGNTLVVPERILQLERELKAEWEKATKVAVDAHHAEKAQREKEQQQMVARDSAAYDPLHADQEHGAEGDEGQSQRLSALLGGLTQLELTQVITRLVDSDQSLIDEVEDEVEEILVQRTKRIMIKSGPCDRARLGTVAAVCCTHVFLEWP
jgi:hypothetical protein